MTQAETLKNVLAAKEPEDVFHLSPANQAELEKHFRKLIKFVHPDVGGTTEAAAKLDSLFSSAEKRIKAGVFGKRGWMTDPIIIRLKSKDIKLVKLVGKTSFVRIFLTEGGQYAVIGNGAGVTQFINNHRKFVPDINKDTLFPAAANLNTEVDYCLLPSKEAVMVMTNKHKTVFLSDLMALHPKGLPLEHAAWIINRLWAWAQYFEYKKKRFVQFTPNNLLIEFDEHGALPFLFLFAGENSPPLKVTTYDAAYKDMYPSEFFSHKIADAKTDLYMLAQLSLKLIADDVPDKHHVFRNIFCSLFISYAHRNNTAEMISIKFKEAVKTILGKPKFTTFNLERPN